MIKKEITSETKETFSENPSPDAKSVDTQKISYFANKNSNAVKYSKIFKNCYFYINDISLSYMEYFESCKGRCAVSIVSYRNRLVDIILKRGGDIEISRSMYVTHFIVERPSNTSTWWIFKKMKGLPKQYHFVTAKYIVDSHLKGRRLNEKLYSPKFMNTPKLFRPFVPSEETSPKEEPRDKQTTKVSSFRFVETWPQAVESECLEDFEGMDCGLYMNGNIIHVYLENFLLEVLIGENIETPAASYNYRQIWSVNSHSRKLGVKKGMDISTALDLSNELRLVKYDHDKVMENGLKLLKLFKSYTPRMLSPNYNEYYLQISYDSCRKIVESPSSDDNENICKLALQLMDEVPFECVIGIGKNMLISKLASKKCRNLKINSQQSDYDYELSPLLSITRMKNMLSFVSENICIVHDGFKFLNNVYLSEIPGVGLLWPVLKSRGLLTCNDVRKIGSPLCLQSILGGRVGKLVYNFCFGYDYRCSNLPKKQLDFFLNRSFTSSISLDSLSLTLNSDSSRKFQKESDKSEEASPTEASPNEACPNGLEPRRDDRELKDERLKEDMVLRSLLSRILKQVCSVYSLFDKCIINYSIKYKCNLVIQIHGDFPYSKSQVCILDRQSLRHTMMSLYSKVKKELGIKFSDIKKIHLQVKDILRVDENIKFIDKFLTEKFKTDADSLSESHQLIIASLKEGTDTSDTPRETVCTPTRRINGWRVDSLSATSDTSQQRKRSSRSRTRKRNLGSDADSLLSDSAPNSSLGNNSDSGGNFSIRNNSDSSLDSGLRSSSSGGRRSLKLSRGQKYITEYLSPSKLESN